MKVTLRHLGVAPRKVRLLAALVKGMDVKSAERELAVHTKRSAPILLKLLRSAIANARHNFHVENQHMRVKDVRVDAGPVSSRFRARAFGRAAPIRRRASHISLILETASAPSPMRGRKTGSPAVRTATAEDLRGGGKTGKGSVTEKPRPKKKTSGFMPRIFQRKAI